MNICVLYGGRSGEHAVSLRSAAAVMKNLDRNRYRITAIGIDRQGRWHLQDSLVETTNEGQDDALTITPSRYPLRIVPSDGIHSEHGKLPIDCVFPVLHGANGEDGTMQGLLEIAGLSYVGAGVLGSSASMDKVIAKRLWREAGLPIVEFAVVTRQTAKEASNKVLNGLGWPIFVKPATAGSSLGTSRANSEAELEAAVSLALQFSDRALLEKYIADAREIECAVIGNTSPRSCLPGEIVPAASHSFYGYEAKYLDPFGAELIATADLETSTQQKIMEIAETAYRAVCCEGMARVDFFLEPRTGSIYLNEINTIPGFTSISMFPRMCEASGLSYAALLDTLINLACDRHDQRNP